MTESTRLPAVLVDLDGTLADNSHRGPYEYELLPADRPIYPIIELVQHLHRIPGYPVIFMTGREDRDDVRPDTVAWLGFHVGISPVVELLMRPGGDFRPDEIVKRELYEQHVQARFDVQYVFDDRQKVVNMWRSLGLTVLDVAGNTF